MTKGKQTFHTLFTAVSALGALFVLTEAVLQSFGRSICVSDGCKMTAQYARFGDLSILLAGFTAFSAMLVLSLLVRRSSDPAAGRLLDLVLVVALAGEGFFMGFLAFRIQTLCIVCVSVFGFIAILGVLRLLAGKRAVLAGFAAFLVVFFMQYLILPAGVTTNFPSNERLLLFYSKDCKHCTETIREFEEKKIPVTRLPVEEYAPVLKSVGIDNIPTLLVNDPYQKVFITGEEAISRYLASCTGKNSPRAVSGQVKKKAAKKSAATPRRDAAFDIFNSQPSLLTTPQPADADNGMCREDAVCK